MMDIELQTFCGTGSWQPDGQSMPNAPFRFYRKGAQFMSQFALGGFRPCAQLRCFDQFECQSARFRGNFG